MYLLLHPPLQIPTKLNKSTHCNKLLCRSPQEQLPVGGIALTVRQRCSRAGPKSTVPGVLEPVIFGPQTQQPVETDLRPQQTQSLFEHTVIQNGDTRDHKNLPPGRGVSDLHRFQGRILPDTYKQSVLEVSEVPYPGHNLPIQSTTLWSLHSPIGVYGSDQRGQITGNATGYKSPPVPRRLVGQSQIPPNLSPTYTDPSFPLSRVGLASEQRKIRTRAQTSFQFCRLPV